jgi:hypothetical protein
MSEQQPSGWAIGWTAFAGIMMIMMGGWWVITGLVGLFNSDFYVVTLRWIFQFDISTWAWIQVAGFFLFSGATWARVVGVIIAVVAGLLAFAWLPYYPVWAILFIVISIGVIWALTAHGHDITMA